jgi:hypothetical protein
MRKYLLLAAVSAMLLCSCSSKISHPSEIEVGKTIKYGETKTDVVKSLGEGKEEAVLSYKCYKYKEGVEFVYNKDGILRYIKVIDEDVDTYMDISVGDDVGKVADMFQYEMPYHGGYTVLFDGKKEVDQTVQKKDNDWIYISYDADDNGRIDNITILDVGYARYMR